MLIGEKRHCDFCQGIIEFGQKHVQIRSGRSEGKTAESDYRHYHHRFPGDCWDRERRTVSPPSSPTAYGSSAPPVARPRFVRRSL